MAKGPERIHDVPASEGADRAALLAAFLLGAAGTIFLKVEELQPIPLDLPPVVAALFAALVLIGYVISVWQVGSLRIEPETIGDNCYYLGFVFTLTSLAVTLYQISGEAIGSAALQAAISGFGIALSSTIVGIVLRVWLMRLRPDLVARDRAARIELHTAAREFRAALATSTTLVKSHAVETTQLMAEERAKLLQIVAETIQTHRDSMKKGAEVQLTTLERTMSKGAEKSAAAITAAVERALEASSRGMTETVAALRASLAEFVGKEAEVLKRLAENSGAVSRSGADAEAALAAVAVRLEALAIGLDGAATNIVTKLGAAAEAIERSSAAASERIGESFSSLGRAADGVARTEQFARSSNAIEAVVAAIESSTERFAKLDAERLDQAERTSRALNSTIAALEAASQRLSAFGATEREGPGRPRADLSRSPFEPSSALILTGVEGHAASSMRDPGAAPHRPAAPPNRPGAPEPDVPVNPRDDTADDAGRRGWFARWRADGGAR